MEPSSIIIGIVINKTFKKDYYDLFDVMRFPKMELINKITFSQLIKENITKGDEVEHGLVIGNVNNTTIIFDFELYNQEEILKKYSIDSTVFTFYMNKNEDMYVFSYYENGELIRNNYSDDVYDEIGSPFDIETKTSDKFEIINYLWL